MSSQNIEFHRFPHNESCTEDGCRARKFYIEDGKKFCQGGHEQAGFTQTQQDEDDFNSQGLTTRKKRQVEEHVPTVLSGKAAKELYLQCLQLILWKQCHWLVTGKRLNSEIETVVRDLWGLRVSAVLHGKNNVSSQAWTDGGIDGDRVLFGSQSEIDPLNKSSMTDLRQKKKVINLNKSLPKLIETLSLCYLGMLLMRLPISLGELLGWAIRGEILYLRAIKNIPEQMRSKLPSHYYPSLELRSPLKGCALHSNVLDLIQFFNFHYEINFPPLNGPLLFYKHVRDLGLPVEIYPAAQRLGNLLGIDFKFPVMKSSNRSNSYPEVRLMSLILIAAKLSQPHDDIRRDPLNEADPSVFRLNWKEWAKIMITNVSGELKKGEEINQNDTNVFNMSEKEIDQYLDWYQNTWIDDQNPKSQKQIEPQETRGSSPDDRINRLKTLQASLIIQKVWSPGDESTTGLKRPGELYRCYRVPEELNEDEKSFYKLAASRVGISLKMLVQTVFHTEIKLEAWVAAGRRKKKAEDKMSEEDTSNEKMGDEYMSDEEMSKEEVFEEEKFFEY